jgi:hypothetical protein
MPEASKLLAGRLSAATPPDDITQKHASQRDASPLRLLNGRAGAFAGIPSGCRPLFQPIPVVSLALNHRLKASMPPASGPSFYLIRVLVPCHFAWCISQNTRRARITNCRSPLINGQIMVFDAQTKQSHRGAVYSVRLVSTLAFPRSVRFLQGKKHF